MKKSFLIQLEIIEKAQETFGHTKPLDGKLRKLMDVALLKSSTKEPVVKGMK